MLEGDTVWQTRAVVPHAGSAIRVLREPFVQTYVLWGALAALMIVALRRIWSPTPDLDLDVLDELADDLGSVDAAHAFARTFTELIVARVQRVEQAVAAGDAQAMVEAGLSLEVTAATVGALRLSERSRAVTEAVEAGDGRRARRALRALRRAADPTAKALGATLRETSRPLTGAATTAARVEV
jgi:HPt (histidine-containing phosphotransfer) domain-containing protein